MGVAIYAITLRPLALLIVFMSPLMMLGNFIGQKTQQGKKLQQEIETFESQLEDLEETLVEQTSVERERRHAEAPAVAEVYEQAMRLGPLLWTRRPEHWNFLALRLGVGRAASRNSIQESSAVETDRPVHRRVESCAAGSSRSTRCRSSSCCRARARSASRVPSTSPPTSCAASGCSCSGSTRPNELITTAIVDPAWSQQLDWLKWLPHTTSTRNPVRRVRARRQPVGRHGAAQRPRGGDPRAPVRVPDPTRAAQ